MAGLISKTLLRHASGSASQSLKGGIIVAHHRHRSSKASKPQFMEMEMTSSSSLSHDDYAVALKLFDDDFVQRVLVKKATPDWLPFLPGSSFWVPPRPSPSPSNFLNLVHKFTYHHHDSLSSQLFAEENESVHGGDTGGVEVNSPEGMEGTVHVKVLTISENLTLSEDEEG